MSYVIFFAVILGILWWVFTRSIVKQSEANKYLDRINDRCTPPPWAGKDHDK